MANSTDKPETGDHPAEQPQTRGAGPGSPAQPGGPPQPGAGPVEVDDSHATATYANFCRVTGTPEELIIDFGLNSQPFGPPTAPIPVTQRIITNFYTAKRLLQVLQVSVQRHEQAFGVLETDVQKRAVRMPPAQART